MVNITYSIIKDYKNDRHALLVIESLISKQIEIYNNNRDFYLEQILDLVLMKTYIQQLI